MPCPKVPRDLDSNTTPQLRQEEQGWVGGLGTGGADRLCLPPAALDRTLRTFCTMQLVPVVGAPPSGGI